MYSFRSDAATAAVEEDYSTDWDTSSNEADEADEEDEPNQET